MFQWAARFFWVFFFGVPAPLLVGYNRSMLAVSLEAGSIGKLRAAQYEQPDPYHEEYVMFRTAAIGFSD